LVRCFCSKEFCSVLYPSSNGGLAATPWTYFLRLSLSSVILIDSSPGESCPRLDVVHPGRAWPSSPASTWHCSLRYLFLQATPLFPRGVTLQHGISREIVPSRGSPSMSHDVTGSGTASARHRKLTRSFSPTSCEDGCSTQCGAAARDNSTTDTHMHTSVQRP